MKTFLWLVLLGGCAGIASGQGSRSPCEPDPALRRELAALEARLGSSGAEEAGRLKALAEEILARHPEDYFAHNAYLMLSRQDARPPMDKRQMRETLIGRYRRAAEERKQDSKYTVLYARALLGLNTPLAIELLEKLLERVADPQAHLTLGGIRAFGRFAHPVKAPQHLDSYVAACRGALDAEALHLLSRFGSAEAMAQQSAALRGRLTDATDPDVLRFWEYVWTLEFKARPVAGHEALRKQLGRDLERLEAFQGPRDDRWAALLLRGYRMASDTEKLRQAEDRLLAQFPRSDAAKAILRERWRKQHPLPQRNDPDEKKQAFYRSELAWLEERLQDDPGELLYLVDRLRALSELKDSSREHVAAAADELLAAWRRRPPIRFFPPLQFQIAEGLLKKDVRIERVPALIREGLREFLEEEEDRQDDRMPREQKGPDADTVFSVKTWAARILLDAAERLRKPEMAASIVGELEAMTAGKAAARSSVILEIRARLAELQGRKLDALLLYRRAMEAAVEDKEQLGMQVARLRKELGGTEATKELWEHRERRTVEVAEGGGHWEAPPVAMPAWELTDLAGRTWKLTALRGKTLLINVWATWCGPCRQQHPHLEKLYQETKHRSDLQILSFNVDEQVGLVAPYVRDNGYTFPVLLAGSYVQELLPEVSIPQDWIVDAAGTWRLQRIGFGSGENWRQEVLEKLEQIKREAASGR